VVDVPGHEGFVRTMVAGASGIDLFLMVVAADDGVMPQTREHAAVLRGLGVVVERLERVRSGAGEPNAPEPAAAPARPPGPTPAPRAPSAGAREAAPDDTVAPRLSPTALALEERLRAAGHEPPDETALGPAAAELSALRAAGRAVRVGRSMHAHPDALAAVRARVEAIMAADGGVTIAPLRDELGTSRKYAQALLEHLDAARVTLRLPDDRRVPRRRGSSGDA
jgi:selenocysteine-specific elongation factor